MSSQPEGIQTKKEIIRKQCEKCHGNKKKRLLKYIGESQLLCLEKLRKSHKRSSKDLSLGQI